MSRSSRSPAPTVSEQLEALLGYAWPFPGGQPKHDLSTWIVTDDGPENIPVKEAEVEVFERWFGACQARPGHARELRQQGRYPPS